jgi:hypothetical protein
LKGKTSLEGYAGLPSIRSNLVLDWNAFNYQNGQISEGKPTLSFDKVQLDLGSFVSNIARPVLTQINNVIQPFTPIVNFLNTDIPLFNKLDLTDLFDQNGDGQVTMLEVASTLNQWDGGKPIDTSFIDAISDLQKATQALNSIVNAPGDLKIDLGSYTLGQVDSKGQNLQSATPTAKDTTPAATDQINSPSTPSAIANFFSALNNIKGLSFPILSDPSQTLNLLLGNPATLFQYDVPDLNLNFSMSQSFPVIWPLSGVLQGDFSASTNLAFGYDTQGFQEWKASGFTTAGALDLLDGFYAVNQPGNELQLNASVGAGFGVDVGLADGYITGGIQGNVGITIANNYDKLRASDITANLSSLGNIFNINGEIDAILSGFAEIILAASKKWTFRPAIASAI